MADKVQPTAVSKLEALPCDVLDNILTNIDDVGTLCNTVVSAKVLHQVYKCRSQNIIETVVKSEVGLAADLALVVVRGLRDVEHSDRTTIADHLNDSSSDYWTEPLRGKDAREIHSRNLAGVANRLEDEFSMR